MAISITTRILDEARQRGLAQGQPVSFTFQAPNSNYCVRVITSYEEPVNLLAPLDLLWLDPATSTLRKRTSRAQSQDFVHTWEEIDTDSDFYAQQIWDEPEPEDQYIHDHIDMVGNAHGLIAEDIGALSSQGGTMVGPLIARTEPPEGYADNEFVSKYAMLLLVRPAQQLAQSVRQQLNSLLQRIKAIGERIDVVEQKITTVETFVTETKTLVEETKATVEAFDTRITTNTEKGEDLQRQIDALGAPGGIPRLIYQQETEETEWIIVHELNTMDLIIDVKDAKGQTVLPDICRAVSASRVLITFAVPSIGSARLLALG